MNKAERKALDNAYEQLMKISLNQVPVEGLEALLHPNIMGWGTTLAEEIHSVEAYVDLIRNQEISAREHGLDFVFERERIHEHYASSGDVALIVERIQTTINSEGFNNQFSFRFSVVMVLDEGAWKLIHWHGSIPSDIGDDVWHVEEWKAEKERLEQLVAEKTADLKLKNRELEIEAASHRVRTVALSMHVPEDIMEVLNVLREEIQKFDLGNLSTYIWTVEDKKMVTQWDITEAIQGKELSFLKITYDPSPYPHMGELFSEWKSGSPFLSRHYKGKALDELAHEAAQVDERNGQLFREGIDSGAFQQGLYVRQASYPNGVLGVDFNSEPSPEVEELLIRMADAFGLAYQRFKDLQKAEKQAYESTVEASLERVRSMAASMNHSDDLKQIAETMFRELEVLKIEPLRYGIGLINGQTKEAELWASEVNDGQYLNELGIISMDDHPMLQLGFKAWADQHEEVIYELKGEELRSYYAGVATVNPHIPNIDELTDSNSEITHYWCFFPFKTGGLYAFTLHKPEEQGLSILKRFANVFEQAYTRFEDLYKTEEQAQLIRLEKERLEEALDDLRATQEQLVQQEKLASLGQLTAGIAHEIKNPLNFVNNFSDLNLELMEELQAEMDKSEPDPEEIAFLLDSIRQNTSKVLEHGSRADRIVKSMLQHSRGGSGSAESVDLNTTVQEYVNLSFHGMRASKEPINVDLKFEMDESLPAVPLKTEDFSRVIVNVCNNAFDAMRNKLKQSGSGSYNPVLSIRTSLEGNKALIEIEDNGPGIPEALKDKIMQPFFTTKKGKEGTGLGLSISHDIVKSHGGYIDIETNSKDFTRFKIYLATA